MKSVINYSPKEKAVELMSKFVMYVQTCYEGDISFAKECAIILVEEILKLDIETTYLNKQKKGYTIYTHISYWKEVINEIKNL